MARRAKAQPELPAPDQIEGVPLPREAVRLVGHEAAEAALLDAFRRDRMHHAWLIGGDEGIGKASLAFRMARFVLAHPDGSSADVSAASSLDVPADHPAAIKIAHGTHGNILHIQREWDEKGKKFKTGLSVESIRRIIPFLGTTAGEGAWRIVIVDSADDMSRSAANALLKALEEPPAKTLFFLISSTPGRLLPTIRSRCRQITCKPLSDDQLQALIKNIEPGFGERPDHDLILALAAGSPRRALSLIREDGSTLYRTLIAAFDQPSHGNMAAVAEKAADQKTGGPGRFLELLNGYLDRRVRGLSEPDAGHKPRQLPLATWAELWEKAARSSREAEIYNLDVRHYVLDILESYSGAVRQRR
jgi:DNA polymerase-3 subunit delta'